MKTIHTIVTGRVQGVGFRHFAVRCANDLGLCGWVKNMPDGGVETMIQGQDDEIDEMIRLLKRGPGSAIIRAMTIEEAESEELPGFTVRF